MSERSHAPLMSECLFLDRCLEDLGMRMRENDLELRLQEIYDQLHWLIDCEARSAWVKSCIENGVLEDDWERLIWVTAGMLKTVEALADHPSDPYTSSPQTPCASYATGTSPS